jgi:hypothetical protein
MTTPERTTRPLFPNPFYVLLVVVSTLFVVTILAYLVAPSAHERAAKGGGPAGPALWLERHGPTALGVEFAVMLAAGLLAMATDRWFPSKADRRARPGG